MAKIVKKNNHLENEYSNAKNSKQSAMLSSFMLILLSIVCFFIYARLDSLFFLVGAAFMFIIGAISFLLINPSDYSEQSILASGIAGESLTADLLRELPKDYTVYQDVVVKYDGRESEIDNIVVGSTGVFVIETKNHNGTIIGSYEDKDWLQKKIGRGGTPYESSFYSPVKQVGTHIFRLKNLLKKNDVRVYINGIVYFSNPQADVIINGAPDDVPVFSASNGGNRALLEYILNGNSNLSDTMIKKINKAIDK